MSSSCLASHWHWALKSRNTAHLQLQTSLTSQSVCELRMGRSNQLVAIEWCTAQSSNLRHWTQEANAITCKGLTARVVVCAKGEARSQIQTRTSNSCCQMNVQIYCGSLPRWVFRLVKEPRREINWDEANAEVSCFKKHHEPPFISPTTATPHVTVPEHLAKHEASSSCVLSILAKCVFQTM